MRSNRLILLLFILALVAVPAAADCGESHAETASATEAKPCCAAAAAKAAKDTKPCCAAAAEKTACGGDCAHAKEALALAMNAEQGCDKSMDKLIAMIKESDHEDAIAVAAKAEGGCEHSQAELIAMVKEHLGGEPTAQTANMTELAKAAGGGCAKSSASLIAAAKKSDDPKMVELATRAAGGCEHSKAELIAMVNESETATATE